MSWLKVDDRALAGPVLGRVSRDARLMHIEALAWSMSYDGTGVVPKASLRRATDAEDVHALAAELVAAEIWTATDDDYQIVFMLDDQTTPEEMERQKEYARQKAARQRRHRVGDHSMCDPRFCRVKASESPVASPVTSPVTSPVNHHTPTRPDPTRPKGGSKGQDEARSAPSGLRPSVAPLAKDSEGFSALYDRQDESHAPCAVCGVVGVAAEMVYATFADGDNELVHEGCADDPRVVEVDDPDAATDEDPE